MIFEYLVGQSFYRDRELWCCENRFQEKVLGKKAFDEKA
jgi:hypothetical protein